MGLLQGSGGGRARSKQRETQVGSGLVHDGCGRCRIVERLIGGRIRCTSVGTRCVLRSGRLLFGRRRTWPVPAGHGGSFRAQEEQLSSFGRWWLRSSAQGNQTFGFARHRREGPWVLGLFGRHDEDDADCRGPSGRFVGRLPIWAASAGGGHGGGADSLHQPHGGRQRCTLRRSGEILSDRRFPCTHSSRGCTRS